MQLKEALAKLKEAEKTESSAANNRMLDSREESNEEISRLRDKVRHLIENFK